jgi:nicotinamidase-related amidase
MTNVVRCRKAILVFLFIELVASGAQPTLLLPTRSRVETAQGSGQYQVVDKTVKWDPAKTAIVICDMWNQHWCKGATERVAEMAPRMNEVIKEARRRGIFIIHCPSDTMSFYKETPQRKLAQAAPPVTPRVPLLKWCNLTASHEAPLPIDDTDGGCDDWPPCKTGGPWTHQIDTIEIKEGDAITDSAEAYYLMQQRGIENVIVMGVHLNMCVLGRPFSIRQMVNQGKNVLLMRDLTDTMYNSRSRPYVNHFAGTDLMIEHVEKFWCPSITSVAAELIGQGGKLGVIAQGRKQVLLREEVIDYGPGQSMLTTIDLPVVAHVTRASAREPFLGMMLTLDARAIVQLAAELEISPIRKYQGYRSLSIEILHATLLDALTRLLALLDEPALLSRLAPLIQQEITIRL